MINRLKTYITFLLCLVMLNTNAGNAFKKYVVDLYGHLISINFNADFFSSRDKILDELSITNLLKAFEEQDNDSLIKQLDKYSAQFKMDDIAYLLMLNKVADEVYDEESTDLKTLFKYGLLKEKGYDVILGYGTHSLTLYGYLNLKVLNVLYIQKNNKTYTDLSFKQNAEPLTEREFTAGNSSGGGRSFNINEHSPPLFNAKKSKRSYHFEYDAYQYFVNSSINQSLVEYYHDLPDIEFNSIYLNYGLSAGTRAELVKQLQEYTKGMYTAKAVDFILCFTQYAFDYKKDADAIGKEKFSFPEEVLANPYSDCEDKSVLFAYLVKEVLGIHSIALFYKSQEHLNVAVPSTAKNDINFTYNSVGYTVCEPSGLGLRPGEFANDVRTASIIQW